MTKAKTESTVGKLAESLAGSKPTSKKRCKLSRLFDELDEADVAALNVRLADEEYSSRGIAVALNEAGYRVSKDVIQSHRDGLCVCQNGGE